MEQALLIFDQEFAIWPRHSSEGAAHACEGNKRKVRRFPHEETWLREFVGFHGTDCVTRFSDGDLGGVSLTLAIETLRCGEVVEAEKSDGSGTVCTVEYHTEERTLVRVSVHFASNEEMLAILRAEIEELTRELDRAA